MLNIEIRTPKAEERKQLNQFFETVITDTFSKEGIGHQTEDIKEEISTKKNFLESYFTSNGKERFFLIALSNGKMIGSIEFGPASDLIKECTTNAYSRLMEIGTVFVHPDFQRNGVGNLMLKCIYKELQKRGIVEFCLDSGYTSAQKIWMKKFGPPDYLLKDYWGEGFDHMIWKKEVKDCL
ncbi:GNAT family N-acetyltransferase [Jeotgalibacillus proteolyticus]|uniref:GNAT family N-acetyltransferase n=1 Tax=Jeotgalibacillus proteolyticus TaxID=2082395 RepID=A0A2S5G8H4_9BACL|nr:GNAT family N-acetyltransferase [Jeotgalibacillus proteolyticus]PPA69279.1 GNAT family N-acetyltransferase [Jeotgalibacillus proteolyticus]